MKETENPNNYRDFVNKKIKIEEIEELLNQIKDEPKTEKQVKKYILQFEKSLESNLEQRQIYKEPLKYMESEVELSENIRKLFEISSNPLFFPTLFQLNSTISILSLLTHENTDIAIQCIELIFELTEEDSVNFINKG
jgi:beta-catenin-like protein 1